MRSEFLFVSSSTCLRQAGDCIFQAHCVCVCVCVCVCMYVCMYVTHRAYLYCARSYRHVYGHLTYEVAL